MITPALPDGHFLASDGRDVPLVVAHATGTPAFALVDGQLVPYGEWAATLARPQGPGRAMTLQSANGTFSGALQVS